MRDNEALIVRGTVVDEELEQLRADNQRLRRELTIANGEIAHAKAESARALGSLRKQLAPMYRALQQVFGEIDTAGVTDEFSPTQSAAWDEWKRRLGPSCAHVIDALLLGGEMTVTAIAVAAKMGKNTVYQATSKMGQAGILVRNGGKFSLKSLAGDRP